MSRLLVVGLDGATFSLILPLIADGRLPTLTHLITHGAWGPLQSTVPPITPSAWTTVFTGKNPGKHGIFDFQEMDLATYQRRPVYTNRHLEKTVWDLLGEAGLPSIVIDVPYTFPPRPLDGLMITGYGTPRTSDTLFTYPEALAEEVPPNLRPQIRIALPQHNFDRNRAFLDEWQDIMNGRAKLLKYLIREREWSLFFHVFSITDNLSHIFWTYNEPSHPNYYRREAPDYRAALYQAYDDCDRLLGKMLSWAGPNCRIIVMSDHGFGSVYTRQYLFQRLVDGGFLHYGPAGGRIGFGNLALKLAVRTYNRLPWLREWVKNLRPDGQHRLKNSLDHLGLLPGNAAINYQRSTVLPSDFGLQLWLNRADRFAGGIVPMSETAVLQDKLADFLLADIDKATGEPIIKQIYCGQNQYHGPHAAQGPDLIVENNDFYQPDAVRHPVNPHLEGSHTSAGIFIGYGPDIQTGALSSPMHLRDLAPTMLHLLNQPVPIDMDGRVLTEILTTQSLSRNPVQTSQTVARHAAPPAPPIRTPAEEAALKAQLRRLGYID